jgi:hypothetical protein
MFQDALADNVGSTKHDAENRIGKKMNCWGKQSR